MSGISFSTRARALIAIGASLAGLLTAWMVWPEPTEAETLACFIEETGTWTNRHARSGDITRVQVESQCKGNRLVHRVRVLTKCAPRDCTWGWAQGAKKPGGRFVATFATYSAYRYFQMDVTGDHALVSVTYDYHDERKDNEAASFRMVRDD